MHIFEAIFNFSTFLVMLAAFLDILANMALAASNGFKRIYLGLASLAMIASAFYFLSLAVKNMDLAIAYGLWGSFGLIGTCLGGWLLFNQKPDKMAFMGVGIQILGIILLHMD